MKRVLILGLLTLCSPAFATKPNVILIMADDFGYECVTANGGESYQTPNLDKLAAAGVRFENCHVQPLCTPTRVQLMTGRYNIRNYINFGTLPRTETSFGNLMKQAGYATGICGKWQLGAQLDAPQHFGFDEALLWQHTRRPPRYANPGLELNGVAKDYTDGEYGPKLINDFALEFVTKHKDAPFFLYWSMVIPHANNERARELGDGAHVPDYGPYADKDWPNPDKGQAAMITRMDSYVGRMMRHLDELGLAQNTLVIFTSDNGPHNESKHDLERFDPNGPYTGIKRSLTDGGIRVPFIAWWPGKVKPGSESAHVGYFPDWLPTAAELAGAPTPEKTDGISLVPVLTGKAEEQPKHEFLYWEFHEGGFKQAALYQGRWKGIRQGGPDAPVQLFDQQNDIAEQTNVAAEHPQIAEKISAYLKTARTPLPEWEPVWKAAGKGKKKG